MAGGLALAGAAVAGTANELGPVGLPLYLVSALLIGGAAVSELVENFDSPSFNLFHYTDAAGAAGIQATGLILPSSDGSVYLTPTTYQSGAVAQAQLALARTPTGRFDIPFTRLVFGIRGIGFVSPANGQPGGGIEVRHSGPVNAAGIPFRGIGP